jgi:acetyl-CoA acetyltransferase
MTRFGRRDEKLPDLMAEAALAAMADAGIDRPDAVVVAAMNPEEFTGEGNYGSLIATRLGLSHVPALRVETATSSGVAAVYMAFAAIAAGLQRSVLVVGGEKMTHLATPRVSEIIAGPSTRTRRATARRCRPWRHSSRGRPCTAAASRSGRSRRWP